MSGGDTQASAPLSLQDPFIADSHRAITMSCSRLVPAPLALIVVAGLTAAEGIWLVMDARNPGVENWISYDIVGPRNHPLPILYFSARRFKTAANEHLIVLRPARQEVVTAYTDARITRADCPGEEPRVDGPYAIRIKEHHGRRTQRCVLPRPGACEYLSGLVRLPAIQWSEQELGVVDAFVDEFECGPLGP